jgi:DNA polymerase III delta prime subunit
MEDNCLFSTKYKPKTLEDFFFNESVKQKLQVLKEINEFNVLFIGNSNTGKTSLLSVLTQDYYECSAEQLPQHNIMVVNNLKEQGIHFFRNEMQTFCKSQSGIYGKKKIILVDDIDMINQQNQHVFCNYIDKYQSNVIFLFAGSNQQKIIENIQSRVHILQLQSPRRIHMEMFMKRILQQEQLHLTPSAQSHILTLSGFSLQCITKHLEKIKLYVGKETHMEIDETLCRSLCSLLSMNYFETYFTLLQHGNLFSAIQTLYGVYDYGYSVIDILFYMHQFVVQTTILCETEKYEIVMLLCKYITIFHNVHEDAIELALFTRNIFSICKKLW